MTPFDYKKEYKALYLPKEMPSIVEVPSMQYAAVRGHGDPNEPEGEYGRAVAVLYGISYTIKMSYKGSRKVDGFFEYVVPPLEGFWWMEGGAPGVDYRNKSGFNWISIIRVPEGGGAAKKKDRYESCGADYSFGGPVRPVSPYWKL